MREQRGAIPAIVAIILLGAAASAAALAGSLRAIAAQREAATQRSLAQAREALVSHAADRAIDAIVGPGYLPCPDLDDDGWAESTCGSLSGHLGQAQRLGRLPWKTLGLPDLRDGDGERLWYAVSTRHKGLLNCAASAACVDMSPPHAVGTITLRDASGALIHDGTRSDAGRGAGAAAVVIAPGAPLERAGDGRAQRRDCAPADCDARGRCLPDPPWRAARCDPANYLDVAAEARFAFEDNAAFHDRSDAAGRPANGDGFVQGPVRLAGGRVAVNDRVAAVAVEEITARVMARVAVETAQCLRDDPPVPTPACGGGDAHPGRVPDASLAGAGSRCFARATPGTWWSPWQPHVLLARGAGGGIDVVDDAGRVLARSRRFAILVTREPGDCAAGRIACDAAGCRRAVLPPPGPGSGHALVAMP